MGEDEHVVSNAEKLQRALDYLGKNWLFHKDYTYNPKHSPTDWHSADTQKSK